MQADDAGAVEQFLAAGQHAAFTGGEVFGGVEAESGEVCAGTDGGAFEPGSHRMRGIFNQFQPVFFGNGPQRIQFHRVSGVMHGDDGPGGRGDGGSHSIGLQVECVGFHIHEDRAGSNVFNHIHRCGKGHRSGDDFVSGADIEHFECHVQSGGAGVECECGGAVKCVPKFLFELPGSRTGGQPARLERCDDFVDFFGTHQRQRE